MSDPATPEPTAPSPLHERERQPTSGRPDHPRPQVQFRLAHVFWFATGLSVLFAVLAALGPSFSEILIGFGVIVTVNLLVIAVLTVCRRWAGEAEE